MTIWEYIYRKFTDDGTRWASQQDPVNPVFERFVEEHDFPSECVLDVGCGDGKYLAYLEGKGFIVEGIDSSETAVALARVKAPAGRIRCEDMFRATFEKNRYGLVLSVSALHHGRKRDIRKVIRKMRTALVPDGWIFLIVPSRDALGEWETFEASKMVGDGEHIPLRGPEKGLHHSFFSGKEMKELLSNLDDMHLEMDERKRWIAWARKGRV